MFDRELVWIRWMWSCLNLGAVTLEERTKFSLSLSVLNSGSEIMPVHRLMCYLVPEVRPASSALHHRD